MTASFTKSLKYNVSIKYNVAYAQKLVYRLQKGNYVIKKCVLFSEYQSCYYNLATGQCPDKYNTGGNENGII